MDYYDLFSFSAKKAIYRASEICAQFSNQYVEPEHILYSVMNLRSCSAVQVLHQLGVNLPKLTYSLEAYLYEHAGSFKGQPSFSARTLSLLDTAFREVKRLHHREIGTTHLLIALAQEQSDFVRTLLAEHDLDAQNVRDTFIGHLSSCSQGVESGTAQAQAYEPSLPPAPETVVQAVLAEAKNQARSWNHESVQPLHLLAAVVHLYPECDLVLDIIGNRKPAKLIYSLLNSVKREVVPPSWHVSLGEAAIEVLVGCLRRALQDGRATIGWQDFTKELMASFNETQRALIKSIQAESTAPEDPASPAAFFSGLAMSGADFHSAFMGVERDITGIGDAAPPSDAPLPPGPESGYSEEE
jgi:hypothetical protein